MSKFKKGSNHSMDMASVFNRLPVLALKADRTRNKANTFVVLPPSRKNDVLLFIAYLSAYHVHVPTNITGL